MLTQVWDTSTRLTRCLSCRIQSQSPESEMDNYASFISEALEKTKCRECVPSWEEIQMLMSRQEMLCTVHYPGPGSCQLYISSHTTANEVRPHISLHSTTFLSLPAFPLLLLETLEPEGSSDIAKPNRNVFSFLNCVSVHLSFQPLSPTCHHQVVRRMQEKLSLQDSKNTFALYEQNALWEQPVAGSALIADILTRFET